jgi:hypothetical protein
MNDVNENWGSPADPDGTGFEDAVSKLEREDILRIEALRVSAAYFAARQSSTSYDVFERAKDFYDWLNTGR